MKAFGYTHYGAQTAICLNVKFHSSVNAKASLSPFHMIQTEHLGINNPLTRVEGVVPTCGLSAFHETMKRLKLESKIAFMKDELNHLSPADEFPMGNSTQMPRIVGHIQLDPRDYPDDDLPF